MIFIFICGRRAFVAGTGIKLAASIYMLILIVGDLIPTVRGWFA